MLAKSWKKICLIILIIACLWNIISKFVYLISFDEVISNYLNKSKQEQTTNVEK